MITGNMRVSFGIYDMFGSRSTHFIRDLSIFHKWKIELPTAENQIVIQYLAIGEVRGMRIA